MKVESHQKTAMIKIGGDNMPYSVIDDIMRYYHFNFIINYALFIILLFITIAMTKKNNALLGIASTLIALCAYGGQMMFLGILADNGASILLYSIQLVVLSILSILMAVLQLIMDKKSD